MKNVRLVLLGALGMLLVVLILGRLGWLGAVVPARSRQAADRPITVKRYHDPSWGYRFSYPSTWSRLSDKNLFAVRQGFSAGLKRDKPAAIIGVRVTQLQTDANLNDLPDKLRPAMAASLKDFEEIGSKFTTVGGVRALKYSYRFKSAAGRPAAQRQLILVKDRRIYYLVLHASPTTLPAVNPEFDFIADSFRPR